MNNITNIQLRAARQALNIGIRDIAKLLNVSKATISKAELGKTRDFLFKHSARLVDFFQQNNIIFPNEYTIRLMQNESPKIFNKNTEIITRFQLRSARCVLNFSQQNLANKLDIDKGIISRAELLNNFKKINPNSLEVIFNIKNMFLQYGVEFPDPYSIFFKKYVDNKLNP